MLSQGEYKLVCDQAPILVWRCDAAGARDYFNERWLSFRGRTLEQERGDGWLLGVHPEDRERCRRVIRGALADRAAFEVEVRLLHADGAYRWVSDRGVPYDRAERFAGLVGSCVDVTARVQAERELVRRSEASVRHLHGLLPICSCCKKIRDDQGHWHRVEEYISRHSAAVFTHALCADCLTRLYPEYVDDDDPAAGEG